MSNLLGDAFVFECEAPHRPTIDVKQQKPTTFAVLSSFEVEVNGAIDFRKEIGIHLTHKSWNITLRGRHTLIGYKLSFRES